MVANAGKVELGREVEVSQFTNEESKVVRILVSAFNETEEDARELMFNTQTPNRHLMIAKLEIK